MRKRLMLGAAGLVSAAAIALPAGAQAAIKCPVTGTMYEEDFVAFQNDSINGNTEIQQFTHPIDLNGGISGVGWDQERAWGSGKTLDFTSHDNVTFDPAFNSLEPASMAGLTGAPLKPVTYATVTCPGGTTRTGTLQVNFLATGNYAVNGGIGAFTAHWDVVGSGGGLAGTTGSGTMSGIPGVPAGHGPYTGTLQLP